MAKILNFPTKEELEPHNEGEVVCVHCKHEWVAVAPVGVCNFECPKCSSMSGVFNFLCAGTEKIVWQCNCGNTYFVITPEEGTLCAKCGLIQVFD